MHAIRVTLSARIAAAVAATALTAGGIVAAASLASAAPKPKLDATRLSISNRVIAHGKHHVDAVTGVLSSDDKGVAGETVALEARTGVRPRWKVVATGATGTGGAITFDVTPKAKMQFKYVFAGDSTFRASHSNVITLSPVK
ncbi:MAG TPA: hypothetical protein VGS06_17245 [Streptosporangiaceae bacterium]|nr:hypothetical protein [Streptosporangiaceae bacterium]